MTTLHDVLRWMVRGGRPNTEANQRQAIMAIDAHEQGFGSAEEYEEHLNKQAAAAQEGPGFADPAQSAEDRAAAAEAENVRLQALLNARRAAPPMPAEEPPSEEPPAEPEPQPA